MKRESHVITRYSWDGRTKSVIDYILVDREWGEKVTNVKVIPSVSADGDHRLLVGQWKMNQCVKNRKQKKVMRIRDWKLKESECTEKYRELITQKFPKEVFCDVEKEWSLFKDTLVEAAQKVCGRTSGKEKIRQTSWWDDTTNQAVRRKNGAWRKWWKTKNDEDRKRYIEEKKKCKEIVETAKKKAWEEYTKKLEEDVKSNKKMFYKMMKNKRKASEVPVKMETEDGTIIEDSGNIKDLWKEHFKKLLNAEEQVHEETTNNGEIERSWEGELGQITREEMEKAVKKMNGGKAPGPDEVSVNMIRAAGPVGMQWLCLRHTLFKMVTNQPTSGSSNTKKSKKKKITVNQLLNILEDSDSEFNNKESEEDS
ncbi:uncharacterized protein LOC124789170 [Schistocerca piceifrons]|uniref:uncharacterized protein LOC124789170 n=1 Tax=Schistocerca piceifrons TaxID=274613 RepID=UPI001F5EC312|nr:uncharacterized protein LOC124789170 [Schistocerca piceifrons]